MKLSNSIAVLVLAVQFLIAICGEDFYKLLEIPRDAEEKQIKKAFRRLSLKYHPDKNKGDKSANEKFLKINKAYETLMDREKRKIYDIYGEEGLSQQK